MSEESFALTVNTRAFQATMIGTAILMLKCYFTFMMIGHYRVKSGGRPPEDEALFKNAGKQDFLGTSKKFKDEKRATRAQENTTRASRIAMNDLEVIPIGLIMAWASILSPRGSAQSHVYLMVLFTLARCGHTWSYSNSRQPSRAIFWVISILCVLGFAINGVWGCL